MAERLRQLNFETQVLVSELQDGRTLAQSITRPQFVAFGSEAAVLEQHRQFLERYLLEIRAADVAGFESPKHLELTTARVKFERHGMPHTLRDSVDIEVPVVLSAAGADVWCLVPALNHTFFVDRSSDRDEAIATELARVAAAADPSDLDLRRLLPAEAWWLETVTVELVVGESGLVGRAKALRAKEVAKRKKEQARETLREAGTIVSVPSQRFPLRFRDASRGALAKRLESSTRSSIAIIGDESVGKSALFLDWVASSQSEVFATSAAQIIAGASGFGEWQERVANALEAAETLDAVLYFENFGELFGSKREGGVDIATALHQAITSERVRVVGEISTEHYERARKTHAGLIGAISPIRLEPLSADETVTILSDRVSGWRRQKASSGAMVEADVAEPVVRMTERYMPYRSFPGKAVRFLEELRVSHQPSHQADSDPSPRPIALADAHDAFAAMTAIPRFLLRADDPLLVADLIASMRRTMIGQERAVKLVAQTLCTVKAQMQPSGKPLSTFLFVGPTGVGKTELARTLATVLFGSQNRMVRFDMSEFTDAVAGDRLIRGVGRRDGLLTSRVRETPFCVLLLDEIEKADPSVHDLLLQVCGSGRLTDGRGRTTFFENTIIIMTSNLGSTHGGEPLGIGASADVGEGFMRAVSEAFRPEMLGRIDRIVPFSSLDRAEVGRIAGLALEKLTRRRGLSEAAVKLVVSDAAADVLAQAGFSEAYGVRALRRHLEQELVTPIAHLLSTLGSNARGVLIWAGARGEDSSDVGHPRQRIESVQSSGGAIEISVFRRTAVSGRVALRGLVDISSLRRRGDDLLALSEVVAFREQASQLTSELAMISSPKKRKRDGRRAAVRSAEIERLQTEHHRVAGALEAVLAAQRDLHAAEELAIAALVAGDPQTDWITEAARAEALLRRAMFWLLTCDRSVRGGCFLHLESVGSPTVAALWLSELCAFARTRGHVVRGYERRLPTKANPSRWGKPIAADALESVANRGSSPPNPLIIEIAGKDAGVLYPIECGLHRFHGYSSKHDPSHLIVSLVAVGKTVPAKIWTIASLAANPRQHVAKSAKTDRDRDSGAHSIVVGEAIVETPKGYFEALEEIGLEHLLRRRQELGGTSSVYSSLADMSEIDGEAP